MIVTNIDSGGSKKRGACSGPQEDTIFLLDSDHYSVGSLPNRLFSVSDVAPTGDATKFAIVSEWTFVPTAPKAHAMVTDLSTS